MRQEDAVEDDGEDDQLAERDEASYTGADRDQAYSLLDDVCVPSIE